MLKIVPTTDNTGYWITIGGRSDFNENLRLGLESVSDGLAGTIAHLQEEIRKVESMKAEVDKELENQGGKYRPRRVSVPTSGVWFSTCGVCGDSRNNINMVAIEVTVGTIKVLCHKCGKECFPSLVR